jgi:hypothetical protein
MAKGSKKVSKGGGYRCAFQPSGRKICQIIPDKEGKGLGDVVKMLLPFVGPVLSNLVRPMANIIHDRYRKKDDKSGSGFGRVVKRRVKRTAHKL